MAAYYNENDPYAAGWLRNLIAAGLIPDGVVDDRSICDVRPEDLRGFDQCHFFAGLGGWAYAGRLAGWPDDRPIWTGSCPCQPYSVAGKGQGKADERHLWPEFFRLIRECRPAVVFGEQVSAAIGKDWLDGVFSDLEGVGYACGALVAPAAGVDAPHRRDRLWFVADAHGERLEGPQSVEPAGGGRRLADAGGAGGGCRYVADTSRERVLSGVRDGVCDGRSEQLGLVEVGESRSDVDDGGCGHRPDSQALADAGGAGLPDGEQPGWCEPRHASGEEWEAVAERGGGGVVADADQFDDDSRRLGAGTVRRERWQSPDIQGSAGDSGGVVADADGAGQREVSLGRTDAERDAEPCGVVVDAPGLGWGEGQPEPELRRGRAAVAGAGLPDGGAGSFWADAGWILGADGKARRVKPGIRLLANGTAGRVAIRRPAGSPEAGEGGEEEHWYNRVGALKALGNAIVPQLAAEFIGAYMDDRPD